jgi:hypothetical protein
LFKKGYIRVDLCEHVDSVVTVYNFGVGNYHSYFVSSISVLTHNGNDNCLLPAIPFPQTPGNVPPGPDWEWRGKPGSVPGGKDGNRVNPKTGESLRLYTEHPDTVGPHWDYKDPNGDWYRVFPDGSNVPKK